MSTLLSRAALASAAGLGLLGLSAAALGAPVIQSLVVLDGSTTLHGQETLGARLSLDAPVAADLTVMLRPSSADARPLIAVPRSVVVPRGRQHVDFRIARLDAAYAAQVEQVATLRASLDGRQFSEPVTITVRPGLPDVPAPCDRPAAYTLLFRSLATPAAEAPASRFVIPSPQVVSGDEYELVATLDCAVRSDFTLPLSLSVSPYANAPRFLSAAERESAAAAAFAGFPASIRVPANQRGATVRLRAGDTLIGGAGRVTGPSTLVPAYAPPARQGLVVAPHPRCARSFTLSAPDTIASGTSFTPRMRRPCQMDGPDSNYTFALETSDAIALPLPLTARILFLKGMSENHPPQALVITGGTVAAPTRVDLRAVLLNGSPLAARIAPVAVMVVPR